MRGTRIAGGATLAAWACLQTAAGCGGNAVDVGADLASGGRASGGRYELGGSSPAGGKIVIPIGSGGKANSGSGGTNPASGGQEGSLRVCDLPLGPSVGDPSGQLTLDDFDDGDSAYEWNGLRGSWFGYHDDAPGTQSPTADQMIPESGGVTSVGAALHVLGQGFDEWGSGIAAPLAYSDGGACLFDGSAYKGITFWAKGVVDADPNFVGEAYDPGMVRLLLIEKDVVPSDEGGNCNVAPDRCWDSHRELFQVTPCWQKYTMLFEDLRQVGYGLDGGPLDLNELYNVNFEIGRGNRYDLWIDDIRFFVDTPAEESPVCDMGLGGHSNSP